MTENFLHIKKGGYVSKELLLAYINGNLSDAESKRIAKLIEADPFLADAVDGLKLADQETITKTLDSIYSDIDIIVGNKKAFTLSATFKKYAAAAMILVFFGLTFLIMNQLNNSTKQQTDIALAPENKTTTIDDSSDMGAGSVAEDSNIENDNVANASPTPILKNEIPIRSEITTSNESQVVFEEKVTSDDAISESADETTDADFYVAAPETLSNAGRTVATETTKDVKAVTTVDAVKKEKVNDNSKKPKVNASQAKSETEASFDSETNAADTIIFVEQMPEFPGGTTALNAYLSKNINYAQCANASGIVYAKFLVKADGNIGDVIIVRGLNTSADAEVLRVLKTMPKWNPGKQNGIAVNVWMTLPVRVELGE